jgi:hypothetical protein
VSYAVYESRGFERSLEIGGVEDKFRSPPIIRTHLGALLEMIFKFTLKIR